MAVPCRDARHRVTEQLGGAPRRLAEFRRDGCEAVPQRVKRHALDLGRRADPRQDLRHADSMTGPDRGRENPRNSVDPWLCVENADGGRSDRPNLSTALAVLKMDATALAVDVGPLQRQRLHFAKTCEEKEPD